MSEQPEQTKPYCIFDYFYCDAGNWSTGGVLLLAGEATEAASSTIKKTLEYPDLFVAEQVDVPSLCPKHFNDCGAAGPTDLDHAYHSFESLRSATADEVATLPLFGSLDKLIERFSATKGQWDVRLSPNVPR